MNTIYVLVLILFSGTTVIDSKLAGFTTEASCKEAVTDLQAKAKAQALDVWAGCVKVEHKPKPVSDRRRGGNA